MSSQLAVLQILDMPKPPSAKKSSSDSAKSSSSMSSAVFNYAVPGMKSTRAPAPAEPTPAEKPKETSSSQGTSRARIAHLEWQGQGKATLAVCVGKNVILYHPVSKRALVNRAEKEAPNLLPMLKGIVTSSTTGSNSDSNAKASASKSKQAGSQAPPKKQNKSTTIPCIVSSSILSHPSLRLEAMDIDEFIDINDLIFQERMTIEHTFVPTSASFTLMKEDAKFEEAEYLLVGGESSLILWKLRKQVINPAEKPRKGPYGGIGMQTSTSSGSFTPARRLGARIGINGIVALTFNEKTEAPKKKAFKVTDALAAQSEFTRESSMGLGTLDQAISRMQGSSSLNYSNNSTSDDTASNNASNDSANLFESTQIPWGQVPEWFTDEDEHGNSLFPSVKTPYRMLWQKKVSAVRLVSFSPDGRLFASVGHSDRHVKVWYYGAFGLNFTYLAHPRAVADVQWRSYHAKRDFCRNVIMTRLVDGTCMMWEETEPTQRLEFALKLTLSEPVTSVQWLLPPVSYLTDILDEHIKEKGKGSSNIPPNANVSNARALAYTPAHAPSSSSSSYLPLKQQPRGVCPFDCQHRTLPPTEKDSLLIAPLNASPKETQDWVAALQKDGSILLWKVKGLGVPKRVPTATLWSRLRQVLSAKVDDFFPHLVVLSQRFAFKEKVYHPALLNVYTSSASKRDIACWTVDTSLINRAQAQLSRRLQGHVSAVNNLQAHPGNALLSSSDKHRTVIWKLTDTTISDSTFVLQDLCGLPAAQLSRWDPLDPVIYLYLPQSSNGNALHTSASFSAGPTPPNGFGPVGGFNGFAAATSTNPLLTGTFQTPRSTSSHAREGIIAYHLDHHDSDTVSAWATSKNLGALENSSNLEDDKGNPVQLGHLEVLPPVYFDSTGACIKLPANESLVLGASNDGRIIYIWKITKSFRRPGASAAPSGGASTTASSHARAATTTGTTTHSVGSTVGSPPVWTSASPLDAKPAFVAAASLTRPTKELSKPTHYLTSSSSQVKVDHWGEQTATSSSQGFKSKMIVRYVLPEVARLSCLAKPVSTHIRDMRQHQSDASLFTGGIDGIVRAWRLHKRPQPASAPSETAQGPPSNSYHHQSSHSHPSGASHTDAQEYDWLPLLYFRAHEEPVESIRCASFGRMATTSTSGTEIKIWECESSSPNFLLEAVIQAKPEEKTSTSKYNTSAGFSAASSIMKTKGGAENRLEVSDDESDDDEDPLDPYSVMVVRAGMLRPSSALTAGTIATPFGSTSNFALRGSGSLRSSNNVNLRSSTSSMMSDTLTEGGTERERASSKKNKSGTCFDWISGPTGSPMLAVVANGRTRVFALQATKHLFEFKAHWKAVANARVAGSVVAWTGLGQLVVGQGNRLLVFTNWIDDSTLTTIAEHIHSALPYYHPKVIFELVMAGRLDRAHTSLRALYDSLNNCLPQLFEAAASAAAPSSTFIIHDADDEYTAELLKNHPDLQKANYAVDEDENELKLNDDNDEDGDASKEPKIVPIGEVEALSFDTSAQLLATGELFLTQKRLGISAKPSADGASNTSSNNNANNSATNSSSAAGSATGILSSSPSTFDGSSAIPASLSASPPSVYIPDYDPTAYDPTAGPRSSNSKSKGLFDSDSEDESKKANAWDSYASHMDDDSRYNIGGMDDNASDSSDDFWGKKDEKEESAAHKRFLDDGYDDHGDSTNDGMASSGYNANSGTGPSSGAAATPLNEKQNFRWNFDLITAQKAAQLCQVLTQCLITGLSAEEQSYLIALIDTLSNLEQTWLDAAAVRFTVMTRFFLWLQRKDKIPSSSPLPSLTWCWALHTSDQQSLLQHCFPFTSMGNASSSISEPSKDTSKFPLLWDTVRTLGIPLWLTHEESLRKLCQDLATQHYLLKKDPSDAALWYLLLGKKSALAALYNLTKDTKKSEFLGNDFMQEKWKSAAVTNAFSLMQRHQYQMAASMFVLAGKLSDAVDVCLSKLDDYMMALFVARVGSNLDNGAQAKKVMEEGLKRARTAGDQQKESALLWLLNDYKAALGSLIPQAPKTTVILSPYSSAPRLTSGQGGMAASALPAHVSSGTAPASPKSSSARPKDGNKRKGFFSSDEEDNQYGGYDYKQFDISSGMSDIYAGYPRDDASESDGEGISKGRRTRIGGAEDDDDGFGSDISDFEPECTNPLYQHHDITELSPQKVVTPVVTPDFQPGIRSLFDFVLSHPTLKLAMQEAEKKAAEQSSSTSGANTPVGPVGRFPLARAHSRLSIASSLRANSQTSNAAGSISSHTRNRSGSTNSGIASPGSTSISSSAPLLPDAKDAADMLMLGELRMKDFMHRKIVYTYIHAGLSRLILQGDLDELAERVAGFDTTSENALETPVDAWLLDASQSPVLSLGSELVARELEFKTAVQFLSKEIEANRSLQVSGSLDTYNRFLQLILQYHSALTPDSIVAALGQFCEHRLYLFHHYLLLRTSSAATPIIFTKPASTSSHAPIVVGELQPIPSASLATQDAHTTVSQTYESAQTGKEGTISGKLKSPPSGPAASPVPTNPSSNSSTTTTPSNATGTTSTPATGAANSQISNSSSPQAKTLGQGVTLQGTSVSTPPTQEKLRDPAAAGQLLIRTAQKITSLCQTLVTNPLSEHQAMTTQNLAHELAACLSIHVSDTAVTFSAKARAGVGAAVRLGLFVAYWSTKDYAALCELLSSRPTLDNPRGTLPPSESSRFEASFLSSPSVNPALTSVAASGSGIPNIVAPTPRKSIPEETEATGNSQNVPSAVPPHLQVSTSPTQSASAPNSPAPSSVPMRSASAMAMGTQPTDNSVAAILAQSMAPLFPTKEESILLGSQNLAAGVSLKKSVSEPLSVQTELFLSRLLDVVLLVAFTHQQEEFLAGSFPNPGSLNLVKTLKSWMLQLENQLKDIPVQIIEERLQDITEKESRFVFDIPFFAPFIRETKLYEEVKVSPKLWTLLAGLPCVAQYLHAADYLKQSMRFVRMHNQLRDDFDETERNEALHIASAWGAGNGVSINQNNGSSSTSSSSSASSASKAANPLKDPQRINLKLGDAYTLFKHKDILQSFCINAACRKQIAIATSHGIAEIHVEHKAPLPFIVRDATSSGTGSASSSSNSSTVGGSSSHHQTTAEMLSQMVANNSSSASFTHRRTNSDGTVGVGSSNIQTPAGMGDLNSLSAARSGAGAGSVQTGFASGSLSAAQGGLLGVPTSQSALNFLYSGNTSTTSLSSTGGGLPFGSVSSASLFGGSSALGTSSLSLSSSSAAITGESIDKQDAALWLESHPTLPFYMSASSEGPVKLWQFNVAQPAALTVYRSKQRSKAIKVRFNHNGNKFAAIDAAGNLEMWRFDSYEESIEPYLSLPLLKKGADFAFMNAGSVLAVTGEGSGGKNVCVVDTLIAPNKAVVASYNAHDQAGGAGTAIAYSSRHQFIISGGQRGQICVYDARQRKTITSIDAHTKSIKDIFLDPTQTFFATAGADGNVKFYSLINFKEIQVWSGAHVAKGFARSMSSITGVTQVKLSRNSIYSCGADGKVVQRRYSAVESSK